MKKILALTVLSFSILSVYAYADTCPVQPNTAGWNNPFSISSGTWAEADWKQINNGTNCYYQSNSPSFSQYIYKSNISQPTGT